MQDVTETELTAEYSLFNLNLSQRRQPYTVTMNVEGQDLPMEIDTGASLSIISDETRKSLWPNK